VWARGFEIRSLLFLFFCFFFSSTEQSCLQSPALRYRTLLLSGRVSDSDVAALPVVMRRKCLGAAARGVWGVMCCSLVFLDGKEIRKDVLLPKIIFTE
jgi:hypothetical protein